MTCSTTWSGCGMPPSPPGAAPAEDADEQADENIAALVAAWPLERAEAVARAFTVYFHLANLAEEHQRIRTLRERDTGGEPLRESLAAAVPVLRDQLGPGRVGELLADLRVHPVLTAHPTEARRRAVTETAAADQRAGWTSWTTTGWAPRPGRGPAPAARGDRPAVAHLGAAGAGHAAAGRGPHRHDRLRRDAVPAWCPRCTGRWTGRCRATTPAGCRRWPRRSCATAAGSAPTGTATRSSPPRSPCRPRRSRPSTRCARWRTRPPGSAAR